MAAAELSDLMRDVSPTLRRALREATEAGSTRDRAEICVALLFLAPLERPGSDFARVLAHYGVNRGDLARQLNRTVDAGPARSGGVPRPAEGLTALFDAARGRAPSGLLRSGLLMLSFLEAPRRLGAPAGLWPALARILPEALWADFAAATAGSSEGSETAPVASAAAHPTGDLLARYTLDLTAEARAGRIDPIHGRHAELQQIVNILGRRRQNNALLVGDAGVGKTAVAEAFALKVAAGEVPPALRRMVLLSLDLAALQAGTGARGDFEGRLRALVDAVEAAVVPTILFIDEAHALVGAGGAAGQSDAATLLKPALARGSMRMIAATTWAEYKRHFERDPALTRRFQLVRIDEPDEAAAAAMLHALTGRLSRHHEVPILAEAVGAAVSLSIRHVADRRLPDKAVGVLDTACARVALARVAPPAAVDALAQRRDALRQRVSALDADARLHGAHPGRLRGDLEAELVEVERAHDAERRHWQEERALVAAIADARAQDRAEEVAALESRLAAMQGSSPRVPRAVDRRAVAAVVAEWSGLPIETVLREDAEVLASLAERLAQAVVGQPAAVDRIARAVRMARAELDGRRPTGALLLAGPDSVGKRRAAESLADILFGGAKGLFALNMAEYQEAFSVSALRGAPRGYVGWGEGGLLTEAVRRSPHRVMLFENVERAHPAVQTLLAQLLETGTLEDSDGLSVDFRDCLLVMTTTEDSAPGGGEALLRRLSARLGGLAERATLVGFMPLDLAALAELARRRLDAVAGRLVASHNCTLRWDADMPARLAALAGAGSARRLDAVMDLVLLSPLAARLPGLGGEPVEWNLVSTPSGPALAGTGETATAQAPPPPAMPSPVVAASARLWTNWR